MSKEHVVETYPSLLLRSDTSTLYRKGALSCPVRRSLVHSTRRQNGWKWLGRAVNEDVFSSGKRQHEVVVTACKHEHDRFPWRGAFEIVSNSALMIHSQTGRLKADKCGELCVLPAAAPNGRHCSTCSACGHPSIGAPTQSFYLPYLFSYFDFLLCIVVACCHDRIPYDIYCTSRGVP